MPNKLEKKPEAYYTKSMKTLDTLTLRSYPQNWDYKLIDSGEGFRLEQWGKVLLARPDPQAIWKKHLSENEWRKTDANFCTKWEVNNPEKLLNWQIQWQDLKFKLRLTPFKHTGIFPEQAVNWEWLTDIISLMKTKSPRPKILNLFGYTGAASILIAKLGGLATHVDASKPAIVWAKENQALNNLPNDSIRWILDDAVKFVKREVKREAIYDGIVMDPPAFGHSPTGKTWKFNEDFPKLLSECMKILNDDGFLLVNAYAVNMSALGLKNIMSDFVNKKRAHQLEVGELCLEGTSGRLLSTGIYGRFM